MTLDFDLKGATCIGEVAAPHYGYLFAKEGKIFYLHIGGASTIQIEERSSLIWRMQKKSKVFKEIFGGHYFEQLIDGRTWILHEPKEFK